MTSTDDNWQYESSQDPAHVAGHSHCQPQATSLSLRDLERGTVEPEKGTFDLHRYLRSSRDADEQARFKSKRFDVTWHDLEVIVKTDRMPRAKTLFDTLWSALKLPSRLVRVVISPCFSKMTSGDQSKSAIHRSSGILESGEMLLVLGRPGSGCSTFLRAIGNDRSAFADITGEIQYSGTSHLEMAKYHTGELVYNHEDDTHIPTLTVSQTLEFALSTKKPSYLMSNLDSSSQPMDALFQMLNIPHTRSTLVGDEFVRGVSGGERKRVSIAEMLATRAPVQCWDNSTRGLDASTALDVVKALRAMTDVLGYTNFVSLYQAGEGIYELFDKVMVLDQGHQIYYGPASEARNYFESLGFKSMPRQSTADYLTGCTDPSERQYVPGRSPTDVLFSPQGLERSFRASSFHQRSISSIEKCKTRHRSDNAVPETTPRKENMLGIRGQVWALTHRQFKMRLQDRFQLFTSMTLSTVLAIVLGAAYLDLPQTAAGGFTRGSVIFASTLSAALDAFGEIPMMMTGRSIIRKQTRYGFYRPAALPIANTLSDLPFSAMRILIYNVIIYFMVGLHRSAGAFWTFQLFSYLGFLTIQGFFRTIGLMCSDPQIAFRISIFFVPHIVQYSGYFIPVFLMKRWLFWIYYLNPYSYIFAGLMENEFGRIELLCTGNYVVPRNPLGSTKYPEVVGQNQACTLIGSVPGSSIITGQNYISAGFRMDTKDLWRRNLVVSLAWLVFFQVTQVVAVEYFQKHTLGDGIAKFIKENKKTKGLNATLEEHRFHKEKIPVSPETNKTRGQMDLSGQAFTWEKLEYTVPIRGGNRRLLHDVCGYVKPGTMTALMGSSGAGKTTCLDVLAQRKNTGVVSGVFSVNGQPLDSSFARNTAYAEQMDVHESTATVREAMRFSAYLRQPFSVPKKEKDAYVEELLELLELQDFANAIVHSLGTEARKRLTIGVELASKPQLLLFLDEPTSGLDAQSALSIIKLLRRLADNGQAILCTIHQPSSLLFESFDRLLLLQYGGKTVYFGDIGADASIVRDYFGRNGATCPETANVAEFMLEAIGAGVSARVGDRDWADIWAESNERKAVLQGIETIKNANQTIFTARIKLPSSYATPFFYQLRILTTRASVALWRTPDYILTRLFMHATISLTVSLAFLQLGDSVRDLQSRVFVIFWVTILPAIIMGQLEPWWISNRKIFVREFSSRIYSSQVFALSQLLSELPYSVICALIYWVIMVYPIGFGKGSAGLDGTGIQLLVILFMELFGVTLGQLIGAISPSVQVAVLSIPFSALIFTTFCGVNIPFPNMVIWARSWLYYLDPYTRTLGAMVSTELHGLKVSCKADEFSVFDPPPGDTCESWAGEFVQGFGGYLDNADSTSACRYCQYKVGDEFFLPLGISYEERWRDVWVLFAFFVFNVMMVLVATKFLRFTKR